MSDDLRSKYLEPFGEYKEEVGLIVDRLNEVYAEREEIENKLEYEERKEYWDIIRKCDEVIEDLYKRLNYYKRTVKYMGFENWIY